MNELNDIELEKVTGGVSSDDISNVKSLISQIITAVSAVEDNSYKTTVLNCLSYANMCIDYSDFISAKNYLKQALNNYDTMKTNYGIFLNIDLDNIVNEITTTMGWYDFWL